MGNPIVYCGGCGTSLREDDFAKGKAHTVDNRPYCTTCKPIPESRPAPSQIQTSSKLTALPKPSSTRGLPAVTPSTRRRQSVDLSSRTPLLIGAALVIVALIILAIFMAAPGGRSPEPLPPPAPPPRVAVPPPVPAAPDRAASAFKELEAFAATSPTPVALLQRCDDIRATVQGTPFEARVKAIEDRAKEARQSLQVDAAFAEVKKLREFDREFERREEILRLLEATLPVAGPRRGEVNALIDSYRKEAAAYVKKPPPPPPPAPPPAPPRPAPPSIPSSGAAGSYDLDARGCINHWLVLGPFPNRKDPGGIYDGDLLKTELNHVPAPGLEVTRDSTKYQWTPVVVSEGKLQFRTLGPAWQSDKPAIAFAACWVVADKEMEVKFRTGSEGGFYVMKDHQRIRNLPGGQGFNSGEEDVYRVKLTEGPHLVLIKIGTIDAPFAVRLRVTDQFNHQERASGVRVLTQPPGSRKLLYSQTFEEGPGSFKLGEIVDGGVNGTKAYAIIQQKGGVTVEGPFKAPVTADTTIRVKLKPLFEVKNLQAMLWSSVHKKNCWYHVPKLKKDEWNVVEFKVAAARVGYRMDGPGMEGDVPLRLTFYYDDQVADGRILIDDFEILE